MELERGKVLLKPYSVLCGCIHFCIMVTNTHCRKFFIFMITFLVRITHAESWNNYVVYNIEMID